MEIDMMGHLMLIIYSLMITPYTGNLMSNTLKKELEENRYLQHGILCLTIMIVIEMLINKGKKTDVLKTVVLGLIIYVVIILSTKMNYEISISFFLALVCYLFYEKYTNRVNSEIMENNDMSDVDKKKMIDKNNLKRDLALVAVFSVEVVGVCIYYLTKYDKFSGGGKFDEINYFFN